MQSVSAAHGRFVWFELMTTDPDAAIAFYGKVVGWTIEVHGANGYRMWKTPGGNTIGGVMTLPDTAKAMGAPPNWMGNLCVTSVDQAVARVQAHDGALLQPAFDIPNVGRVAIVADPTRAAFALYQPADQAPGHAGQPAHGEVSWSELATADPDKAWAFYADVAGWQKTSSMEMGPAGTYQMFGPNAESTIGGMMRKPDEMPVSAWTFYFYVNDLDQSLATAKENGATVLYGPMEIPGGDRVASLLDPQGACFALHGK